MKTKALIIILSLLLLIPVVISGNPLPGFLRIGLLRASLSTPSKWAGKNIVGEPIFTEFIAEEDWAQQEWISFETQSAQQLKNKLIVAGLVKGDQATISVLFFIPIEYEMQLERFIGSEGSFVVKGELVGYTKNPITRKHVPIVDTDRIGFGICDPDGRTYTVVGGDVGSIIAIKTGASIEEIGKANPETPLNRIRPGDNLVIPGGCKE